MKDKNWSYLAGIIDGEGTISLYSTIDNRTNGVCYGLHIQIANVNETLMKWLVKFFGGRYQIRWQIGKQGRHFCYHWAVTGSKNRETVLLGVLPYLIIKREQALLALEFVRMKDEKNPPKRKLLMDKCKALNSLNSGVSPTTNTLNDSQESKIESVLQSDLQSEPTVTLDS